MISLDKLYYFADSIFTPHVNTQIDSIASNINKIPDIRFIKLLATKNKKESLFFKKQYIPPDIITFFEKKINKDVFSYIDNTHLYNIYINDEELVYVYNHWLLKFNKLLKDVEINEQHELNYYDPCSPDYQWSHNTIIDIYRKKQELYDIINNIKKQIMTKNYL
tara:strand:- start:81 stop:572 length:492 start_codon:yes stop_codon:yes gene_type:complete